MSLHNWKTRRTAMGFRMGLQEDSEGQPRDSGQEEGRKEGKGGFSAGLPGGNAAGIGESDGGPGRR